MTSCCQKGALCATSCTPISKGIRKNTDSSSLGTTVLLSLKRMDPCRKLGRYLEATIRDQRWAASRRYGVTVVLVPLDGNPPVFVRTLLFLLTRTSTTSCFGLRKGRPGQPLGCKPLQFRLLLPFLVEVAIPLPIHRT